jgi:hypothetical protein
MLLKIPLTGQGASLPLYTTKNRLSIPLLLCPEPWTGDVRMCFATGQHTFEGLFVLLNFTNKRAGLSQITLSPPMDSIQSGVEWQLQLNGSGTDDYNLYLLPPMVKTLSKPAGFES